MSAEPAFGLVLTIDLGALAANWRRLAELAAPAECAAVVKADAYGIGIEQAVPALAAAGCRTFFVALPEEGRRVRGMAPTAAIYVLDGFLAETRNIYFEANLRPVLNHFEALGTWARLGEGRSAALHADSGMNRLGLSHQRASALAGSELIQRCGIRLLMSHLACADETPHPKNGRQLLQFAQLRNRYPSLLASLANSAGIGLGSEYHFDMVRPGIALYGGARVGGGAMDVVVTAEARVLQVRTAAAGESVGYGAAETLRRQSRVAILGAGYADGYLRSAGSSDARRGASVMLRGCRAPLLGRVSMDLLAVDVTDVAGDVEPGETAELFGSTMPIEEVANAAGTISYELLTGLSRRSRRIYLPGPEGAG